MPLQKDFEAEDFEAEDFECWQHMQDRDSGAQRCTKLQVRPKSSAYSQSGTVGAIFVDGGEA